MNGQQASGVYTIQPATSDPFNVLCEINSGGSRRISGYVKSFAKKEGKKEVFWT